MHQLHIDILSIIVMTTCLGCTSGRYIAPHIDQTSANAFNRTIDLPFDSTWNNLIQYLSSSSFYIDHSEKASGLVIVSFGSLYPGQYVTGGHWELKGNVEFSGDYVDYLVQRADGNLQASMNIVVLPLGLQKSKISVNASYFLSATIPDRASYSWSFDSGSIDIKFVYNVSSAKGDSVTIAPTHKAEFAILEAVSEAH